jgi:cell division protein FtsI (penicillin-binding protein 3)
MQATLQLDTLLALKNGKGGEWKKILNTLQLPVSSTPANNSWVSARVTDKKVAFSPVDQEKGAVPDVTGMGLKDALYLLENAGLRVVIKGAGKVKTQSLAGGTKIGNEQTIVIELS